MSQNQIKTNTSVSERVRQFEEKSRDIRNLALIPPVCFRAYQSDLQHFMRENITSNFESRRSVDEILGTLPRSPVREPRRAFEYSRAPINKIYGIVGVQHHGAYGTNPWLHANDKNPFQDHESVKDIRKKDMLRAIKPSALSLAINDTSNDSLLIQRSSTDTVESAKEAAQLNGHKVAHGLLRRSWNSDIHKKLHKDPPAPKLTKANKKDISAGSKGLSRKLGLGRYRKNSKRNRHASEPEGSNLPSVSLDDDNSSELYQLDIDRSSMEVNAGEGSASQSEAELERDVDSEPCSLRNCDGTLRVDKEADAASNGTENQIGCESDDGVVDAYSIPLPSGVENVQLENSRAHLLHELQHHIQRSNTVRSDGSIGHQDYGSMICGPYTNQISQKVPSFGKPPSYSEVVADVQRVDDYEPERKRSPAQALAQDEDEADYQERLARYIPPRLDALFGQERAQFEHQLAQNEAAYRARMAKYVQDDSEAQSDAVDNPHEFEENGYDAAADARSLVKRTASYTHQDALSTIDEASETEEESISCESSKGKGHGSGGPSASDKTTEATDEDDDDDRELECGIARRQSVIRIMEPKAVNICRSASLPKGKERVFFSEDDDGRVDTPFQSQLVMHSPDSMPSDPWLGDIPNSQKDHVSWWEGGRSGPLAYGAGVPKFACGPRVHVTEMEMVRPKAPTPDAGRVKRDEVHPCLLLGKAFEAGRDDTPRDTVVTEAGFEDDEEGGMEEEMKQAKAEPLPRNKSIDEMLAGLHLPVLEPIPKEEIMRVANENGL